MDDDWVKNQHLVPSMKKKRTRFWEHKKFQGIGSNRKGFRNEFIVALTFDGIGQPPWPEWIYSGRPATHEEDCRGIDCVFETDVGELYIQVKSSRDAVEKFMRGVSSGGKYKHLVGLVAAITIYSTNCLEGVRDKIIHKLTELREQKQKS